MRAVFTISRGKYRRPLICVVSPDFLITILPQQRLQGIGILSPEFLISQTQETLRLSTSIMKNLFYALALGLSVFFGSANSSDSGITPVYKVSPIGWVRKTDNRTIIEVDKQYQPAMLGIDELDTIWVLYWFDRNDTPEQRSILQVHPRRNPENPLRGVFATRAPVRPNLIALSRCRVLSVQDNVIEIDYIDAFPDTPVLDIKP